MTLLSIRPGSLRLSSSAGRFVNGTRSARSKTRREGEVRHRLARSCEPNTVCITVVHKRLCYPTLLGRGQCQQPDKALWPTAFTATHRWAVAEHSRSTGPVDRHLHDGSAPAAHRPALFPRRRGHPPRTANANGCMASVERIPVMLGRMKVIPSIGRDTTCDHRGPPSAIGSLFALI
jgi:hypothetical protein